MQKFIVSAVMVLLLSGPAVLPACAAEKGDLPITVACITTAPYLDPITEDGQIISLFQFALEGLVSTRENGKGDIDIVPCLADGWQISDDGLTYTFRLKKDVKFYDGTPATTEDWIWSLLRLRDAGASSPWASTVAAIKDVTAQGPDTLVITLKQPCASLLSSLAEPCAAVQSKKHFEKVGAEAFRNSPMGTGPYYFADWQLNQLYVLKKNPYYHEKGKPVTKEFRFVVVPDDNTRIMQLQAGQVDVVRDLPCNRIDELKGYSGLVVDTVPATEQRFVNFNVTQPPLNDPRVRNALRLATNQQDIIKMVLFGYGSPAVGVFPKMSMYFDKDLKNPGYDPAKAKALLAEAGYPNGFKTEMIYSSGNSMMENISTVLKAQWAKIGVDLQLTPMEGPTVDAAYENLKHKVTLLRWSSDTPDPAAFTDFITTYDASNGFHTGWKNDHISEVARQAAIETNPEKRKAMYYEIQQALYDECPMFPLFQVVYSIGMQDTVHNFGFTGLERYDFIDAWKSE